MYWRRSLLVSAVLVVLGYGFSVVSGQFWVWTNYYANYSVDSYSGLIPIMTAVNLVVNGLLHFFVLWWAFRRYSWQNEKYKRAKAVRPEDVINMLNEDELTALRDHQLPPSQRSGESS